MEARHFEASGTPSALLKLTASPGKGAQSMALYLPKILDILFLFCTNETMASSARVCRAWSEPALRVLWKHLSSSLALLRLFLHALASKYVYFQVPWDFDPARLHRSQGS